MVSVTFVCSKRVLGIRSVVRKRLHAPVQKLSRKVQKEVTKAITPKEDKDRNSADDEQDIAHSSLEPEFPSPHENGSVHDVQKDGELRRSTSIGSKKSAHSAKSNKSNKSNKSHTFAPPAPAARSASQTADDNDDDDDDDGDFDDNGFNHPSTYEDQPWIWVPEDELGVSKILVRDFLAVGVDASDIGATMDDKGTVEVHRNPPDEEWTGGHDA